MNDVTCYYTQCKCRPYVGGETQTSNSKALLTEPLLPLVMDKKNRTGDLGFLRLLQLADFDREEKINTGNPTAGERQGLGWGRGGGKTTKKSCKYQYRFKKRKKGCTMF